MKKILVYDLPTRFFHWSLIILFSSAFLIAKLADSESLTFSFHMLIGLTLGFCIGLRIIWGFFGSRYAKFNSFKLRPIELIDYFKSLFRAKTNLELGHNPASSWAGLHMILLAAALAITGTAMAVDFHKDLIEDIHEWIAYAFIAIASSHVLGIIFHTFKYKDGIGFSMLHGKKTASLEQEGIPHSSQKTGFFYIISIILVFTFLVLNFNNKTRILKVFGTDLSLGKEDTDSETE